MVSSLFVALAASSYAAAQSFVSDPLIDKTVPYTAIPYQIDTHTDGRGPQSGYNICNSTTEGASSMCQTAYFNHLDDFCLFAPAQPNKTIGETEGEEVAWCTKPGRGTRLIPDGALKGVQLIQSPGYIQIAGVVDQEKLNIQSDDFGGELDSGGQDGRGNPIGGLVYSNAFASNNGNNDSFQQTRHWTLCVFSSFSFFPFYFHDTPLINRLSNAFLPSYNSFMGGGNFCAKACDDTQPNAAHLCEHIYDRVGCAYNAPNNAQEGVFERCSGDDMTPVGVYTSDGQTLTWTQPPESEGAITSIPYTPTIASSSNCVTFGSGELFSQLATASGGSGSGGSGSGGAAGASGSAESSSNGNSAVGSRGSLMGVAAVTGWKEERKRKREHATTKNDKRR
ncbi:hypothetical protein K435DRAFT_859481 [Dendrothele bispora CBS 962.96]|uniref:Macrofage activating glyco protein n=1 Tax=Dendrothele bispora (strain CBS 962.96) TaxID=1314807 RepID=A0A4S8M0F8_DENBC|nr:hypothetical protein K435DRAFT_859481 [Dendrothele bispora CBS 962.96]